MIEQILEQALEQVLDAGGSVERTPLGEFVLRVDGQTLYMRSEL